MPILFLTLNFPGSVYSQDRQGNALIITRLDSQPSNLVEFEWNYVERRQGISQQTEYWYRNYGNLSISQGFAFAGSPDQLTVECHIFYSETTPQLTTEYVYQQQINNNPVETTTPRSNLDFRLHGTSASEEFDEINNRFGSLVTFANQYNGPNTYGWIPPYLSGGQYQITGTKQPIGAIFGSWFDVDSLDLNAELFNPTGLKRLLGISHQATNRPEIVETEQTCLGRRLPAMPGTDFLNPDHSALVFKVPSTPAEIMAFYENFLLSDPSQNWQIDTTVTPSSTPQFKWISNLGCRFVIDYIELPESTPEQPLTLVIVKIFNDQPMELPQDSASVFVVAASNEGANVPRYESSSSVDDVIAQWVLTEYPDSRLWRTTIEFSTSSFPSGSQFDFDFAFIARERGTRTLYFFAYSNPDVGATHKTLVDIYERRTC